MKKEQLYKKGTGFSKPFEEIKIDQSTNKTLKNTYHNLHYVKSRLKVLIKTHNRS